MDKVISMRVNNRTLETAHVPGRKKPHLVIYDSDTNKNTILGALSNEDAAEIYNDFLEDFLTTLGIDITEVEP